MKKQKNIENKSMKRALNRSIIEPAKKNKKISFTLEPKQAFLKYCFFYRFSTLFLFFQKFPHEIFKTQFQNVNLFIFFNFLISVFLLKNKEKLFINFIKNLSFQKFQFQIEYKRQNHNKHKKRREKSPKEQKTWDFFS